MNRRSQLQIAMACVFLVGFAWAAWYILDVTEINPRVPQGQAVTGVPKVVFGILLMQCMILGMLANYLWDLFNAGKSWLDITWRGIVLPIVVSPIVFFSIWSLWKGDPITFSLPLIAFQNGFFWQVIFSKAGPH